MLLKVAGVVVAGAALVTGGWVIKFYNNCQEAKQDVLGQLGDLSGEYQRRIDLFTNLANIVKGLKNFEKETFSQIAGLRSGLQTTDANGKVKAMKKLDKAFGILEARMEKYPDLKAHAAYHTFLEECRGTEDVILDQRKKYNAIVQDINTYMSTFPNVVLKAIFNYANYDFFQEAEYAKNQRPTFKIE